MDDMSGQRGQFFRNPCMQEKKDKIEKIEKKTVRIAQVKRSEFKEATQTGFAKALLRQEHIRQREADLGHVAFIMVRKEALRRVLDKEEQLYAKELSQKGLSIYHQRI
ncbi:uncharacterized protein Hap1MRO34_005101 [Clarias gariepinus]